MSFASDKRRDDIVNLVNTQGKVQVSALSKKYKVSEVSIRKDLEILESEGHLKRIHGGAVGMNTLYLNMDLGERMRTNAENKKRLAELVAKFIDDNDTIVMNGGTTLTYVLRAIRSKKNISIVTNSIHNAMEAVMCPGFNVILLGGALDSKYQFTNGQDAVNQLKNYHATKCILSVDGISAEGGLTHYYTNESEVAKKMIECATTVIVAADESKIGKSVFSKITDVQMADILITSKCENREEISALKKLGIEIYEA